MSGDVVVPLRVEDRTPPQDVEAERSVLGGMLLSAAAIADITDLLTGADFYRPAHETIYDAIVAVRAAGDPADPITVGAHLQERGDLARVGGFPYLHTLTAAVPTAANAGWYADIVRERADRRRLIEAGTRIAQTGYSAGDDDDLHTTAQTILTAATTGRGTTVTTDPIGVGLDRVIDALEHPPLTITTGLADLNQRLGGGLRPGQLTVIGARPGVGKSLVGLHMARRAAQTGQAALIVSLEMSRSEQTQRLLADCADVPLDRITRSALTDRDWDAVARVQPDVADLPLHVEDATPMTLADIRARCRGLAKAAPLGVVVVDYLQLIAPRDRKLPRYEQVGELSRGLKLLAQELQVPVVALAQLNRGLLARVDKRPSLGDLRESGSIEADADVVLLLHADEGAPGMLDVGVAKNRHGPVGALQVAWMPDKARVADAVHGWSPTDALDRVRGGR